jgi:hypothetical protein
MPTTIATHKILVNRPQTLSSSRLDAATVPDNAIDAASTGERLPSARLETAVPVIDTRLADLLFGIHDERTSSHHRLVKRSARKEQNAQTRSAAGDVHF